MARCFRMFPELNGFTVQKTLLVTNEVIRKVVQPPASGTSLKFCALPIMLRWKIVHCLAQNWLLIFHWMTTVQRFLLSKMFSLLPSGDKRIRNYFVFSNLNFTFRTWWHWKTYVSASLTNGNGIKFHRSTLSWIDIWDVSPESLLTFPWRHALFEQIISYKYDVFKSHNRLACCFDITS